MNGLDLAAILPIIVLGAGVTLLLLQVAARRSPPLTRFSTLLVLILALAASIWGDWEQARPVTALLRADALAAVFSALLCAAAAICVLLTRDYLPGLSDQGDEYYLLILLATLGGVVLVYSSHVASLLLGLEIMSVSLYALIAYPARLSIAAEAAAKYLVVSGAASAIMLFGFALLYAATGSLDFAGMGAGLDAAALGAPVSAVAVIMVTGGLCLKLSAAPFHLWTPDVYEGAPVTVTAFLATISKAAPFIAMLRFYFDADLFHLAGTVEVLAVLAVLSMLVGNLLALLQSNVKRMLAYSSIAHMGYALIIFIVAEGGAQRALAGEAAAFYFCAYVPTTLAAFGVLALLNPGGRGEDHAMVDDLSGLFWRQPLLAVLMLLALLSLAGIPLTAGFVGKFYLFAAAVSGAHWLLLGALVLGSGIGIYYYLRVVYQMSQRPVAAGREIALDSGGRAVMVLLAVSILALGIVPQALMEYIQGMF